MTLVRSAIARSIAAAGQPSTGSSTRASLTNSSRLIATPIFAVGASRNQSTESAQSEGSRSDNVPMTAARQLPRQGSVESLTTRIKPVPSSFYSTQPVYTDTAIELEEMHRRAKRALDFASIPLDIESPNAPPRRAIFWLRLPQMATKLGITLRTSQYRNLTVRLSALTKLRSALQEHFASGAHGEANRRIAGEVEATLARFARRDMQLRGEGEDVSMLPKHAGSDELGRGYGRGRRKESSARVWIAPTKVKQENFESTSSSPALATSVLINAKPISEYFTRGVDREAVTYPLRLTGLLGAFNVFALARGGGLSGQSGAIAQGLSLAIVAHFERIARETRAKEGAESPAYRTMIDRAHALRRVMKKEGVLMRDTRMVERKKTGKAKARKAYTWVKR